MSRKPMSSEVRKNRMKWKELISSLREVPIQGGTVENIVGATNRILEEWGERYRISIAAVNHYFAKSNYQAPTNKTVASAFVHALDELGFFKPTSTSRIEIQKEELVRILGYELVEKPYSSQIKATESDFVSIEDAKKYTMSVLYHTSLRLLKDLYQKQDDKTKTQILGELEQIIQKYSK